MKPIRLPLKTVMLTGAGVLNSGCVHTGAPSFEFFGAFFPAWILCCLAGVAAAALARTALVSPRLFGAIPYPLAVCTAIGISVALLAWLLLFR